MLGRKPTPTSLKLIQGNPGRRPIKFDKFAPLASIPHRPAHLKRHAKREYDRVTNELFPYGMCSEIDRGLIAMIATAWGRYVTAEEEIEKARGAADTGMLTKTPNGFPVQSPWVAVSNKAIEIYRGLCAEMCVTQATRAHATPGDTQLPLPGMDAPAGVGFHSL